MTRASTPRVEEVGQDAYKPLHAQASPAVSCLRRLPLRRPHGFRITRDVGSGGGCNQRVKGLIICKPAFLHDVGGIERSVARPLTASNTCGTKLHAICKAEAPCNFDKALPPQKRAKSVGGHHPIRASASACRTHVCRASPRTIL